jgi:hypothetical protein
MDIQYMLPVAMFCIFKGIAEFVDIWVQEESFFVEIVK